MTPCHGYAIGAIATAERAGDCYIAIAQELSDKRVPGNQSRVTERQSAKAVINMSVDASLQQDETGRETERVIHRSGQGGEIDFITRAIGKGNVQRRARLPGESCDRRKTRGVIAKPIRQCFSIGTVLLSPSST